MVQLSVEQRVWLLVAALVAVLVLAWVLGTLLAPYYAADSAAKLN